MKILLFYLILSLSFFNLSQVDKKNQLFLDSIEDLVINKLNEHRVSINSDILFLKRNNILDSAAEHHNRYLENINFGFLNKIYTNHSEKKNLDGYNYTGQSPLLEYSKDRVTFFDKENLFKDNPREVFINISEVIYSRSNASGVLNNPNRNAKNMSNLIIKSWLESKSHKNIIERSLYNYVGVSIFIINDCFCVVMVLGKMY